MSHTALNNAEITAISARPAPRPHSNRRRRATPLHILLVEDNASDTVLTEIALDATRINYDLQRLESGAQVLPYLQNTGRYSNRHRPELMLLDLDLPHKDGFEILADMAAQSDQFHDIPIVILTGDQHSAFLRCSYGLNIAAYVTKPCSDAKLLEAFTHIHRV